MSGLEQQLCLVTPLLPKEFCCCRGARLLFLLPLFSFLKLLLVFWKLLFLKKGEDIVQQNED